MHRTPTLPPAAVAAAVVLSLLGLAAAVLLPAAMPTRPLWASAPVVFVAGLWCIPVVLALLRGERWAYVLAMAVLIFLTDATFRTRSWADKTIDWQVLLKGLAWFGCGLVGALRLPRLKLGAAALWVFAFIAVLALSTAWSPTPSYTFLSAMGFLCFLLFALAAVEVMDERSLLLALAIGTGAIVLPSLAISPFAAGFTASSPGSTGEIGRLRGLTDHPIPLAESCAVFIFACLALLRSTRGGGARLVLVLLAAAGIATGLLTQSRLPMLAMAAAALTYWSYRKGGALLMVPVLTASLSLVFAAEALSGFARLLPRDTLESLSRSGQAKELLTLSGRLLIWPYVLERIHDSPWIGYGQAAGMTLFKGFTPWKITHAHNAYLQAMLYVGVVGCVPLVAALFCQLKAFAARPSLVRDVLLLHVLLLGLTETAMIANMPSQGVLLWMLAAAMAK